MRMYALPKLTAVESLLMTSRLQMPYVYWSKQIGMRNLPSEMLHANTRKCKTWYERGSLKNVETFREGY